MALGFHDAAPSPEHHIEVRATNGRHLSWIDEVGMAIEKLLDDIMGDSWEPLGYTYHIGANFSTREQKRRATIAIRSWFPSVLVNQKTEWSKREDD